MGWVGAEAEVGADWSGGGGPVPVRGRMGLVRPLVPFSSLGPKPSPLLSELLQRSPYVSYSTCCSDLPVLNSALTMHGSFLSKNWVSAFFFLNTPDSKSFAWPSNVTHFYSFKLFSGLISSSFRPLQETIKKHSQFGSCCQPESAFLWSPEGA